MSHYMLIVDVRVTNKDEVQKVYTLTSHHQYNTFNMSVRKYNTTQNLVKLCITVLQVWTTSVSLTHYQIGSSSHQIWINDLFSEWFYSNTELKGPIYSFHQLITSKKKKNSHRKFKLLICDKYQCRAALNYFAFINSSRWDSVDRMCFE